jgi:hypothetical protein
MIAAIMVVQPHDQPDLGRRPHWSTRLTMTKAAPNSVDHDDNFMIDAKGAGGG